ncbi:MAG: hypothetical protein QOJ50_163 [Cryptosporangiaceae bacterium]|nr:hypothetical protein [Cryptosporangiaceae bacterium]
MEGMTTTVLPVAARGGPLTWSGARREERIAYLVAAVLFASGIVHVIVLLITGRTWIGPVSLRKAATFGLSFGLTLASVTWALSFLAVRRRALLLGLFTAACVTETVLVTMQAWRGVPSHFNFETPFDSAVSMTLAAGGGVIIVTALGFAASVARPSGDPVLRLAIRFGIGSLLVALGTGAAMIADGVTKSRGGHPQLAYDTAGQLKPLHAVAMHGILVVPALAWALRFTPWGERTRIRAVWAAIAVYSVAIAAAAVSSLG